MSGCFLFFAERLQDNGEIEFLTSSYRFIDEAKTPNVAGEHCRSISDRHHLAEFPTASELVFFQSIAQQFSPRNDFMIGDIRG